MTRRRTTIGLLLLTILGVAIAAPGCATHAEALALARDEARRESERTTTTLRAELESMAHNTAEREADQATMLRAEFSNQLEQHSRETLGHIRREIDLLRRPAHEPDLRSSVNALARAIEDSGRSTNRAINAAALEVRIALDDAVRDCRDQHARRRDERWAGHDEPSRRLADAITTAGAGIAHALTNRPSNQSSRPRSSCTSSQPAESGKACLEWCDIVLLVLIALAGLACLIPWKATGTADPSHYSTTGATSSKPSLDSVHTEYGNWARHFSAVRMTATPVLITLAVGIMSFAWDKNAVPALYVSGVVWLIAAQTFWHASNLENRSHNNQLRLRGHGSARYDLFRIAMAALSIGFAVTWAIWAKRIHGAAP